MPNKPADKDDIFRGLKTGKWTKYGGAVFGLKKEPIEEVWYCQFCGVETPKLLKPFLFEISPGEFLRVCNICMHKKVDVIRVRRIMIVKSSS